MTAPPRSETTARAVEFVADHLEAAEALGTSIAGLANDPDAFARALTVGLASLADPVHLEGQRRVAPGIGPVHGVRSPILAAVSRGFQDATRDDRATTILFLADRLFAEVELEARWFAFDMLGRTLREETERTWQLLRRAAREAADWITVDTLAHLYGTGIVAERYRWSELELLVYSPSRWERRLVGSTIATMSHVDRGRSRDPDIAARGLPLLANLMGDAEADVQKALSWAYRSLTAVDRAATEAALLDETDRAARSDDGFRAWVIRDTLTRLDPTIADAIRASLVGIRKRPGALATSSAAETAARFGALPDPSTVPEPPLR